MFGKAKKGDDEDEGGKTKKTLLAEKKAKSKQESFIDANAEDILAGMDLSDDEGDDEAGKEEEKGGDEGGGDGEMDALEGMMGGSDEGEGGALAVTSEGDEVRVGNWCSSAGCR